MDPCAESFFSSQALIGRVQLFPPGCVLDMGLDTANPYHYTQTQGEIQHVLKIFCGVRGLFEDSRSLSQTQTFSSTSTIFIKLEQPLQAQATSSSIP